MWVAGDMEKAGRAGAGTQGGVVRGTVEGQLGSVSLLGLPLGRGSFCKVQGSLIHGEGGGQVVGKGACCHQAEVLSPLGGQSRVALVQGLLVQTLVFSGVTDGNGEQNSGETTPFQPHCRLLGHPQNVLAVAFRTGV